LTKIRVKKRGKATKRAFPLLWVITALFLAAFVSVFVVNSQQMPSPVLKGARAAIVDQLYTSYPNKEFTTKVSSELEDYGFEVDIYQGDAITVDFYRNLPVCGYNLIIFRVHSGPIGPNPRSLASAIGTYLFTNEPYTEINHLREQLNDEVNRARVVEGYPCVFAIGPKFDTIVIVGGCSCLYNDDLAQAFVDKGASAYLAWDAPVNLHYIDEAIVSLIKNLCQGFIIKKAVDLTMAIKGPSSKYHAVLKYYPRGSGSKIIGEPSTARTW